METAMDVCDDCGEDIGNTTDEWKEGRKSEFVVVRAVAEATAADTVGDGGAVNAIIRGLATKE
jgi:hypothetical protein